MDDRLTSDNNDKEDDGEKKKKKKKKHRKKKKIYVDEMVLSADTADDLEDWLSDIKETTRICRKIVKYVDAIYEKEVESREEEDNIKRLELFEKFNKIDMRIKGRIYLSETICLN